MPVASGTIPQADGTIPPDETMSTTIPAGDVNAGPGDNGAWVTLRQGETLAVTLASNGALRPLRDRTAGYSWQVGEVDPAILAQQGAAVYVQPSAAMPGQGGSEVFLFTAQDAGETSLQLVYKGPGETDVTPTPEQLYTLNIVVEEVVAMETSPDLTGVLTGDVTYRQRIALPPGSVIEVQLQDVSRADAPAQMIASQTITTSGENVPIPFVLMYDPAEIDPRSTYTLGARITVDGDLQWINAGRYAVLTGGNPTDHVVVMVSPAN
jgi:uncharacterized lipoprotein YbaY